MVEKEWLEGGVAGERLTMVEKEWLEGGVAGERSGGVTAKILAKEQEVAWIVGAGGLSSV